MKVYDFFCGVGAQSVGWARAGFQVVGIDHEPQPDYPYAFIQADAFEFGYAHVKEDAIFIGAPPCQNYIAITHGNRARGIRDEHPDLIGPTRTMFAAHRRYRDYPTVIECGTGPHIRSDVRLCGEMFGLEVIRHRDFEIAGASIHQPPHVRHRGRVRGWRHGECFEGYYYAVYGEGGGKGSIAEWQRAMGIDWTENRKSIAEAIPPAYAQYVAERILETGLV